MKACMWSRSVARPADTHATSWQAGPAKLACVGRRSVPLWSPGLEHEQIKTPLPAPTSRFCLFFMRR